MMTTSPSPTRNAPSSPLGASTIDTPIGELTVIASSAGIRAVLWPVDGERDRTGVGDDVEPLDGEISVSTQQVLGEATTQLEEYFRGERRQFDVPLDPVGTEFQQAAWDALRSIEFGRTASYGEQAERMGDRNKARAVGAANGKNPISIIVPCHRVVGSDGSLTGFAGGTETKRWLLDHEARVAGTRLV